VDDVVAAFELCRQYGAPVLSRGGGTSLAGQCCNVAVVLDFSKYMRRVLSIDPVRRLATVQPGCVLDDLRRQAESRHNLTFGPDPSTHNHCCLGGMLGNNSCGVHSLLPSYHGLGMRTSDNTHALDVLTWDGARMRVGSTPPAELERIVAAGGRRGEIYAGLRDLVSRHEAAIRGMPKLPRRVSGYNLDALLPENGFQVARALVGTESTCVAILEATLHLVPALRQRVLVVLGYPDVYHAADHLMEVLEYKPIGLEGIDHLLIRYIHQKHVHESDLRFLPRGDGYLLVEFGADTLEEAKAQADRLVADLRGRPGAPEIDVYSDPERQHRIWKLRESGLGATAWVPGLPDMWPGWEDSAVPPDQVPRYLRELRKLFDRYGYKPSLYGHFGQGCIHCRVDFDLYTAAGLRNWRAFLDEAADLVVSFGGSLSGEHGDGQARAELLPRMFSPELIAAFREFKRLWDPQGRMNPGKVVDPYPITSNLRLGTDYNPPEPATRFEYPRDQHSFARAALRCVGVGECRREEGGVMCPSYMATHEEKHSTRGRARLLWEMLNGDVLTGGWKSEEVFDALDLCLSCKGCRSDCPVQVDMATYKAEFLSHYYEGRLRPRHAYAFGWIHTWARLASVAPGIANFLSQAPGLGRLLKLLAGMDQRREFPPFARETFKHWFARRQRRRSAADHPSQTRSPVILFADTFTDHFHTDVAKAAVEVLEDAGFEVVVPPEDICCGRPLYDYGFLDMARRRLEDALVKLRPHIQAGTPMVVLEPSCAAVFRDELVEMLAASEDARKLAANTWLLGGFLEKFAPDYRLPVVPGKAIYQGHCHQRAVFGTAGDEQLLGKMGIECQVPEKSCCGMAGSFGFEPGTHHEVSMLCGERNLLPAVRRAPHSLLIADGFSCREQIRQATGREPLHIARVIADALRRAGRRPAADRRDQASWWYRNRDALVTVGLAVGIGLLVAGGWRKARRSKVAHRPATGFPHEHDPRAGMTVPP
jgi:FAD/FMN-containing dehydrogenase/Fe-S oxidoreductase